LNACKKPHILLEGLIPPLLMVPLPLALPFPLATLLLGFIVISLKVEANILVIDT
jgi:hypothetical protein